MSSPSGRIDVHFHAVPVFYREAGAAAGRMPARGVYPDFSPELAIELMDERGIGVAITSISSPGVHFGDDRSARELARRCNEYAADLTARWPTRFGAFATLPLPDIQGSIREIDHALDTLKFDGVCLFSSYGEKYLGDRTFDPVMEQLDAQGAVVFVHPAMHPSTRHIDLPWPLFMMEYVFDTTRAAMNLVFSRALERFPRIRFILSHAGGVAPYIAWRASISPMLDPRMPQLSREDVFAGLRKFWYDTALSPGAATMGCLREIADPERIVFGSDWPFANAAIVKAADEDRERALSAQQRRAIDRQNVLALFPRLA
jgi:predicted TIM-barrel fold metal-dependent hydrolase